MQIPIDSVSGGFGYTIQRGLIRIIDKERHGGATAPITTCDHYAAHRELEE
jgi:hypothetical protein